MPDREQFLRAICDAPDDVSPRFIFADWLEEQADDESRDRAEFIRVQCSLARLDEELADWDEWASLSAQLPALRRREQELLGKYRDTWNHSIRERVTACTFSRGFVECVTVDIARFLREAESLCALAPIREVRFQSVPYGGQVPQMQQLAASPALARLRRPGFSRKQPRQRGREPPVRVAASDSADPPQLEPDGLERLSTPPPGCVAALGQLSHLDLSHNYITTDGLQELLRRPLRLRGLVLEGNPAATSNAGQAMAAILGDSPQPEVLRIVLRMQEEPRRQPSAGMVQRLAEEARAGVPSQVLTQALGNSWWKVRMTAAHLLGGVRTGRSGRSCPGAAPVRGKPHRSPRCGRGARSVAAGPTSADSGSARHPRQPGAQPRRQSAHRTPQFALAVVGPRFVR